MSETNKVGQTCTHTHSHTQTDKYCSMYIVQWIQSRTMRKNEQRPDTDSLRLHWTLIGESCWRFLFAGKHL